MCLSEQSLAADSGLFSWVAVGAGLTTPRCKRIEHVTHGLEHEASRTTAKRKWTTKLWHVTFETITAGKIYMLLFWVVTLCSSLRMPTSLNILPPSSELKKLDRCRWGRILFRNVLPTNVYNTGSCWKNNFIQSLIFSLFNCFKAAKALLFVCASRKGYCVCEVWQLSLIWRQQNSQQLSLQLLNMWSHCINDVSERQQNTLGTTRKVYISTAW
jgi:hypothetical protein